MLTPLSRLLTLLLSIGMLPACTPDPAATVIGPQASAAPPTTDTAATDATVANVPPPDVPTEQASMAAGNDPGAGPDDNAIELPPDQYHGNWRVVAAGDRADAALMAISIQSSKGEARGSGDFVLFQPFCDAVAGQPITGTRECELIDMAAAFDQVQATPERIVLVFHPTADGLPHRLELHRDGDRLMGDYVSADNAIRLPVIAEASPGDTR